MAWRKLTKQQWEAIRVHLPQPKASPRGGRPRVEDRRCFEGLLWILWTGAQWSELPRRYGSPSTCWRRLKPWEETGVLLTLWRAFLAQLKDQQPRRWGECFADGRFIPANRGDARSARPHAARGQRGWFWSMARADRPKACRHDGAAAPSTSTAGGVARGLGAKGCQQSQMTSRLDFCPFIRQRIAGRFLHISLPRPPSMPRVQGRAGSCPVMTASVLRTPEDQPVCENTTAPIIYGVRASSWR